MGLYDCTFYDIIKRNAAAHRNRVCWREVDDGRQMTFGEYREQVELLAGGLRREGVGRGDRVGVVGKNSLEFFLIYGAAARLGAIVLPVNWRLSGEEICFNLGDCEPGIVFVDEEFQSLVKERREQLGSVKDLYNLRGDSGDCRSFQSLLTGGGELLDAEVKDSDGFVIIHTAAVAGRPRGALISHGNILCANMHFDYCMEITGEDLNLGLLPLFHVAGLCMVTSTFHAGGCNLNLSKFDAAKAVELIQDQGASILFDFPPILDSILKEAKERGADIRPMRAVIGLGTPETIEAYQEQSGGSYYVMYGQSETSCLATIGRYTDRPGSAGKTIMMGDVQLVDDYENPVETGEVGEITLTGPMVFQGYWGLPEDNDYTFREGRHHTGDLGRFDSEGFLFYAGRKAEKELIKPGGENVYPAEVEKVILQHPAVMQTVVFGVPDPKWKEGIKAVCRLQPDKSLEAGELINFVGERIARFKRPQYVEFVTELPEKEDGSVDREAVKKLYGGG